MFQRFTDHPASVNETYFQHMAMAFGFGGRMLAGALACFVHGLLPWKCLTRGSDTVCDALDLDLSVSDGHGFREFLIATSITKLTPAEVAAIPLKFRP